jgi:hypothetical protein
LETSIAALALYLEWGSAAVADSPSWLAERLPTAPRRGCLATAVLLVLGSRCGAVVPNGEAGSGVEVGSSVEAVPNGEDPPGCGGAVLSARQQDLALLGRVHGAEKKC